MPVNHYEGLFLIDTNRGPGDADAVMDGLQEILQKHDGHIVFMRVWDEKRLAYQIKNMKKGLYILVYFDCESTKVPVMEQEFRITEWVTRQLILNIPEKWLEHLLTAAKEERTAGPAIRIMSEDDAYSSGPSTRPGPRPAAAPRAEGGVRVESSEAEDKPPRERRERDAEKPEAGKPEAGKPEASAAE